MTSRSSATPSSSSSGSPRWRSTTARWAGGAEPLELGDQHGALALAQVVAGRLAGLVRVAEDAEDVVAQLERLAERQAVRREPGQQLGAARRPAPPRAAAGARPCTSPSCSGPPAGARSTSPAAGCACSRTSRYWPPISSVRIVSNGLAPGGERRRAAARSSRAARRSTPGRGRRPGSRRPRRTAPLSPVQPSSSCSAATCRCMDGRPRRVSLRSITSSCSSAAAWKHSSPARGGHDLGAVRAAGAAPAPVAEGRSQPLAAGRAARRARPAGRSSPGRSPRAAPAAGPGGRR